MMAAVRHYKNKHSQHSHQQATLRHCSTFCTQLSSYFLNSKRGRKRNHQHAFFKYVLFCSSNAEISKLINAFRNLPKQEQVFLGFMVSSAKGRSPLVVWPSVVPSPKQKWRGEQEAVGSSMVFFLQENFPKHCVQCIFWGI